jgi:DNA-binding CsgD family transcriptional regulator
MTMANRSEVLDFEQVRRLFRLIAEAREIPAFGAERAQHLVSGVRRIIGAAVGGCVIDSDFGPGRRGVFTPVALDGWDSCALATMKVLAQEGSAFHPALGAMMQLNQDVVTATRQDLVAARAWYASSFVEHYLRPAHLDHGLFSAIRRSTGPMAHGLGFYRGTSDRPFTDQDRNLVRLFHLECEQLLRAPGEMSTGNIGEGLAPRQRQTLELLLQGLTDKEIAQRLGISPYTVNQYTKSIYRHYDVAGRAPLISRLLTRLRG